MVPLLIAIIGIIFIIVLGSLLGPTYGALALFGGLLFLFSAFLEFLRTTVRFATSRITLTTKRIIIKRGLLNRQSFEIVLKQVEGIGVRQPFIGRLFGFGTIVVTGTGGAHPRFPGLHDPQGFRERAQEGSWRCMDDSLDHAQEEGFSFTSLITATYDWPISNKHID